MQTITMFDKTENFVITNDQNFNYVFPIQIGNGPFRLDENIHLRPICIRSAIVITKLCIHIII